MQRCLHSEEQVPLKKLGFPGIDGWIWIAALLLIIALAVYVTVPRNLIF